MPPLLRQLDPLPRSFFVRDPRTVACELLGKLLVRREGRYLLAGRIVEAEAYLGAIDPGAHSYRGMTPRNAVLFGPPGHAYVYFIYGNHYCTNISCMPSGESGCVLLRALEPVHGIARMFVNRGLACPAPETASVPTLRQLTSGPGRLSEALAITRPEHNGLDLCSRSSGLYVVSDGSPEPPTVATPRINVTHAPHDEWRYIIPGNPFVSGPRKYSAAR
jgi:DNA-3-methyladenine glycosylase